MKTSERRETTVSAKDKMATAVATIPVGEDRWERLHGISDFIAREEGAEVGEAWVTTSLFHRLLPVLGVRIAVGHAAESATPRDVAIGWIQLKNLARKRLAEAAAAPLALEDRGARVRGERNQTVLTSLVREADAALQTMAGDTVRDAMYQIGFRKQLAAAEREMTGTGANGASRRSKGRGKKSGETSYEDMWQQRTGRASAYEYMRQELLPTHLGALRDPRLSGFPAPARAALGEWEAELTALLSLER